MILDTININYESFFEQEKKTAAYILQNKNKVIDLTIGELAEASGVSVATVSRFCRKCGLDGFHHLKIALAKEAVLGENGEDKVAVSHHISRDSIEQSLQNILANKIEELKQTTAFLDADILHKILSRLEDSRLVQLAAVGNTIPVALDGAYKFNEIGITAMASPIWETQLAFAMNLTEADTMLAISNSGESVQVMKMIQAAKDKGACIVAITNNSKSAIAQMADYHLQTATREKLFMNEFCFSRISAMTVIEILYLFLTVGQKDSYQKLSECEHLMSSEKI